MTPSVLVHHLHDHVDGPAHSSSTSCSGIPPPEPRMASCAKRRRASLALLAWMVVIDPRWPVFKASRKTRASGPRISPTMILSGLWRRVALSRSAKPIWLLWVSSWASAEMTCGFFYIQFGDIFEDQDAVTVWDEIGEYIGERRFSRRGTS